jgi:hypothetical protein
VHPTPLQVTLSLLLAVVKDETFSFPINLLFPIPNFKTSHLIISPKLVLYPLRTFNQNLKFGTFVLWAMFLEKAPVTEL